VAKCFLGACCGYWPRAKIPATTTATMIITQFFLSARVSEMAVLALAAAVRSGASLTRSAGVPDAAVLL